MDQSNQIMFNLAGQNDKINSQTSPPNNNNDDDDVIYLNQHFHESDYDVLQKDKSEDYRYDILDQRQSETDNSYESVIFKSLQTDKQTQTPKSDEEQLNLAVCGQSVVTTGSSNDQGCVTMASLHQERVGRENVVVILKHKYHRHRKFILISTIISVVFFLIGFCIGFVSMDFNHLEIMI